MYLNSSSFPLHLHGTNYITHHCAHQKNEIHISPIKMSERISREYSNDILGKTIKMCEYIFEVIE